MGESVMQWFQNCRREDRYLPVSISAESVSTVEASAVRRVRGSRSLSCEASVVRGVRHARRLSLEL
eukprot:scaffold5550_cov82-Cyclotella_meneghiniana.AAC.6